MAPTSGVTLVVGVAVLLFGRRLFWLFVAAAGFAAGLTWSGEALSSQPPWIALVVALAVAVLAAMLAVFVQVGAIALGGFLAGAYAALWGARLFQVSADRPLWPVAIVAGIVAALLLLWLWDWALVALSALTGAALLASLPHLSPPLTGLFFFGLVVGGVAAQATQLSPQSKVSNVSTARRS